MAQLINITHLGLRNQLHRMTVADLLGPAGDENEELLQLLLG